MSEFVWETFTPRQNKTFGINVWGPPKLGKSRLCMTCPKPLFYVNADQPIDHLVEQMGKANEEIKYVDFNLPVDIDLNQGVAMAMVNKLEEISKAAIREGQGTLVWDGASSIWETWTTAMVPEDAETLAQKYVAANDRMKTLLKKINVSGVNFIMTNQARDVWSGRSKKEEGVYKAAGFNSNGHYTQWILQAVSDTRMTANGMENRMGVVIERNAYDKTLNGRTMWDPTFEKLKVLSFPKDYPKEWIKVYTDLMVQA